MGVVYRAHDRARGMDVALKMLRRLEGAALYRFKKEFRWLADLEHPNFVTLYELASTGTQWFFTMEVIDGVSFLQYVRPHETPSSRAAVDTPGLADEVTGATVTSSHPTPSSPGSSGDVALVAPLSAARKQLIAAALDLDRLRSAVAQLVAAVDTLHAAGKLHRDIKPSNVMVTGEGRVVLCDFGLVADASVDNQTMDHRVVGTPAYMAPEQVRGEPGTTASDWYAVGVMLYEALTGRQPFSGARDEVLGQKLTATPIAPRVHAPAIPEEVDRVVRELLDREPSRRPGGGDILRALGIVAAPAMDSAAYASGPVAAPVPLLGRDGELTTLRQALRDARRDGRAVAALVHGLSGMGKTMLARRFLDDLAADGDSCVLEGRCYQRESVPFKALDSLIDSLSNHLLRLPPAELAAVIPRDVTALVRLFPVLERVPAIAEAGELAFAPADPHELRRRAFGALRVMLSRLAALRVVVLFIDDLQWGDLDSASFLVSLLYRADSPALLLLGTYRRDERETSALLQALLHPVSPAAPAELREIALDALSDDAARALITSIVGDHVVSDGVRDALVVESRGNPLFLSELARASLHEPAGDVRFETVLGNRIARLPKPAGELLATLAVAGQPTPISVVARAAGVADQHAALVTLLNARLIRVRDVGGEQRLECYHDRIRETLVADLDERALRRTHRRLARALESTPRPDMLALVDHWLGAGEQDKAGRCAALAGDLAARALAFDRAAQSYRLALELQAPKGAERCIALRRLGDALTHTGLLSDAADVYASAAELVQADEALELKRKAMESAVRAGKFDDCLVHARGLLADVGLKLPQSARGAVLSVAGSRLLIKLRGLRFRERPASEVPRATVRQMEVCWSLAGGLAFIDPVMGMAFQQRHLRIALAAGDPNHVALALAYEVSYRAVAGYRHRERCEEIAVRTQALAERVGHDLAYASTVVTSGLAAFLTGRWSVARERFERGSKRLAEIATGVSWEADIAVLFHMATLLFLGELGQAIRLVPLYLQEADERGNQYLAVGLRSWRSNAVWLALGQPDVAEAQLARAAELLQLTDRNFHLPHYYRMLGRVQVALYRGDLELAWAEADRGYHALHRSLIKRIQMTRIEAAFLRARVALASARGPLREPRLRIAQQMAKRLANEACPWADPFASKTRGLIAFARGARDEAAGLLSNAAAAFDALDMRWMAHTSRWRLGELTGDREMLEAARTFAVDQGVVDPERFCALYAPVPVE